MDLNPELRKSLIEWFTDAAIGQSKRPSVQLIDGYWQMTIKGDSSKWAITCAHAGVPADAEQIIADGTLTVRWPSYADAIFADGGLMAQNLPGYEPRIGQLHMARIIQRAIEMNEPATVEAPTGTGKSLTYAAIGMAMDKRMIIATSNKALQMQLVEKDIPFLQTLFPGKVMALAQGKSNYVCIERCQKGVSDKRFTDWMQRTQTGSVEELTFDLQDVHNYTVDDECTGKRCEFYAQCFYFSQKRLREKADIIVCNHALLALNHKFPTGGILPSVDVVVVDEAHQLPNYVRNAIGLQFFAGKIRKSLRRVFERDNASTGTAENLLLDFEHEIVQYISKFGDKQITLPDAHEFESGLALVNEMRDLASTVWDAGEDVLDKEDRKKERRANALRTLASELKQICKPTAEGHVRWIDVDTPSINDAPFDVAWFIRSMVENYYTESSDDEYDVDDEPELDEAQGKATYIFTSATLATPTLKGFMIECGIDHGFQLITESPFDYENNALLYVPNGTTPPPNNPDYMAYLIEEIRHIVCASEGGVFLLFTSWKNMNEVKNALHDTFASRFSVYVQGELPKLEIARRFKEDGNAVLFATKSFWEGVDIPGDALRTVVIDKMPFQAPTPLLKAREAHSDNAFAQIQLPGMIIDLKQGVGRLVRRTTDRGVIAILDSRIRSKPYGRNIVLKSLPPAKLIHSTAAISDFFAESRKVTFPNLTASVPATIAEVEDFTLLF